jgi:gluconate 2-dehydrogenase gamma chain
MSERLGRRDVLRMAGMAGVGVVGGVLLPDSLQQAPVPSSDAGAGEPPGQVAGEFFTAEERRTVRVLVDDILPADDRSGSATAAKVPEFIEAMLLDTEVETPLSQIEIRGGLAWLDTECRRRFKRRYSACSEAQRHQVLDDIAWPAKARPEMQHGAAFFSGMRNFTASGFFSSEMGYKDLKYQGNVFNPNWHGCPEAALAKLGVSYAEWDAKYGDRSTLSK